MKKTIAYFLIAIVSIYGLVIEFETMYMLYGFIGIVGGLFGLPFAYMAAPIYWLIHARPFPIIIIYGGTILYIVLAYNKKKATQDH